MLQRNKKSAVLQRLANFPAVFLVGPRQCGKTTLAKTLSDCYYDLEIERDRLKLDLDWPSLMERPGLIILDEAQSFPEVFPRIRSAIDSNRQAKLGEVCTPRVLGFMDTVNLCGASNTNWKERYM